MSTPWGARERELKSSGPANTMRMPSVGSPMRPGARRKCPWGARRAERSLVVPNERCATPHGLIGEPTRRDGAIFPHDRVALSLMYGRYTALSAPCPAKKWPPSMDIRIVLTGPRSEEDRSVQLAHCGPELRKKSVNGSAEHIEYHLCSTGHSDRGRS